MAEQELAAMHDGNTKLKLSFFENVPEEVAVTINTQHPDESDPTLSTSVNTYLIKTAKHTILVDAGAGDCLGDHLGFTKNALEKLNIAMNSVDTVLLTHAHPDHICGLASKDENQWIPNYPNATIYISKAEYEYWMNNENKNDVQAILKAYEKHNPDSVHIFSAGDQLLENIETLSTAGHTVGHTGYLWKAKNGENWLFWGDIIHNAHMQFAHPEITIKFDSDKQAAEATREQLLKDIVKNNWYVAGVHLPFPGIGKVSSNNTSGYIWQPLAE